MSNPAWGGAGYWPNSDPIFTPYRGSGFVYVLDADHGTKVGVTQGTVKARVDELARAGGFYPLIVKTFPFEKIADARLVEQIAHWMLRDTRTVGEWFHCHPLEAVAAVHAACRREGKLAYFQAMYPDTARTATT